MIFRTTRRSSWLVAAMPAALAVFLYSCSSGGGGGGGSPAVVVETEPNDTPAGATSVNLGIAGVGTLSDETDIDCWAVTIPAGTTISVELYGTRLDHANWDGADAIPRVTILDTDGTTVVFNHDYTNVWSWGKHDLDHPLLYVQDAGTYFICVSVDGVAVTDGRYAIRVNRLSESNIQFEAALAPGATNDTAATAEPIVPGLVFGFHSDDDTDFYSFVITSPSIVRFETIGYRNGIFASDSEYYDMEISLYDTDGITELFNNDDSFFYDSAIQYQIETPGMYFIEVTECCGLGDAPYALSFSRTDAGGSSENEPNEDPDTADSISYGGSITGSIDTGELDAFKFSGKAGDMVRVQIFDSYNSDVKSDEVFATIYAPDGDTELPTGGDGDFHTYTTILQETGTHFIVVEPWGGLTDYRVELTRFRTATYEHEPNDTIGNANKLGSGGRSAGVIAPAVPGVADADVFHFNVAKDRLTTIQIYASYFATDSDGFFEYSGHGSDLEPDLRILDHEGTEIAYSTSDWSTVSTEDVIYGLPCAAVSFVAPEGGRYYVEVTDAFDSFGSEYYYVIERLN